MSPREQCLAELLPALSIFIPLCCLLPEQFWSAIPPDRTLHMVAVLGQHLHLCSRGAASNQGVKQTAELVLMSPQLLPGLFGGPGDTSAAPFDSWHSEPVRPFEGLWCRH